MRTGTDLLRGRLTGALAFALILAGCSGGGSGTAPGAPADPTRTAGAPTSDPVVDGSGVCRKAPGDPARTVPGIGQGQPAADAHLAGMWSPVFDWPLIPVHAMLTPDGRVMSYGTTREGRQTGRFNYAVWDPAMGTGADSMMSLPNTTTTDLFCSAQIMMPQTGRALLAGGDNYVGGATQNTGTNETAIYDPQTRQLTQGTNMLRPRWYGTPTTLGNGEILMVGGFGNPNGPQLSDRAEVLTSDGRTRLLSNVDTSAFNYWYPRAWPTRDGRVFGFELNGGAYYLDPRGDGRLSPVGLVDGHPVGSTSSVAMYAPGRLLVAGGRTSAAVTIDFDGPLPTVRGAAPLSAVRQFVSLSVLPTGDVLATGGSAVENELVGVTHQAEIWSPATGQWTRGASAAVARLYHSTALLLPDGSVVVGGGGAPGPLVNTNAELYFPPYLFEEGGRWATRPTITSAPAAIDPGQVLNVEVESTRRIARLTLVKTGSATHSLNFEQRFLDLPFRTDGRRLSATLPRNAFELSPGYYMVFAIDDRGVPSVAPIVRVMVPDAPQVDGGWTPSIGGLIRLAGDRFTASCEADEVMVGVRGAVQGAGNAAVVGQVQPVCVRTDAAGRWTGTPQPRGVAAGPAAGEAFERLCAANQAVAGLEGSAGQALNAFRLACGPLGANRSLDGTTALLAAVGGGVGGQQPPIACGQGRAATGLYGMVGTSVQALGLVCGAGGAAPPTVPPLVPPAVPPAVPPVVPPTSVPGSTC